MSKKVLILTSVASMIQQFNMENINILLNLGYNVEVACNFINGNTCNKESIDSLLENLDELNVTYYQIDFNRNIFKFNDLFKSLKKVVGIVKNNNYSFIHCHSPIGGVCGRIAGYLTKTKVIYTAHGFHFYKGAPLKNWFIFYPIEKLFSIISDSIITINHEDYNLARNKFYTKINYIHGVGVDEKRYHPITLEEKNLLKQKLELVEFSKIILCIGELLPNKNQKMVIQSMSEIITKYPDCLLLIAGNGPEKNNLEALIEKINLNNNVKLLGYSTCLEKYQGIADVVVSCSKREGLPLNIVEAMLSSNPVVATRNRGHCELISHGKTGYLVDVDDFVSMSNYIKELFENPDKLKIMGLEAQKFAEQYSFKNVKQELRNIYLDYDIGEGGH